MIGQKTLHYTIQQLQQIIGIDKPFGGVVIVMFGDPGQLPLVRYNSLWIDISRNDDLLGYSSYQ